MSGIMYPKNIRKKRKQRHLKSIMHQKDGTCYLCVQLHDDYRYHKILHEHHIFEGTANRRLSEEYGLKVYLCVDHHITGPEAVHKCPEVMDFIHKKGQQVFERNHSRDEFMRIFGRNYL